MNALSLLKAELSKLVEKKGVPLSVIAVLLVPIVYAAILLSATWSPYDNLSNLPVAVVNLDKGAVSGDEQINVGEDLVANLKESMTLGFKFVSQEQAEKGMENQDYYMIIEIPEDFSEKITTVMDENPQIPELRYIQNEGLNFMASQVTNSATEKIREQLGNTITETYAKNLFSQLGEIANGFKSAAEGSGQIYTGSTELHEGTTTMVNSLEEKAPDIDKLADGAQKLEIGTQTMLSSLTGKQADIAKLAAGAKQVNDGAAEILSNLKGKSGDIAALAKGAQDLKDGTDKLLTNLSTKQPDITRLANGAAEADAGTSLLLSTLEEKQEGITALAEGAATADAGTAIILKNLEDKKEDITKLASGSAELSAGVNELLEKITLAAPSITKLHEGAIKLNESSPLLQGGSGQVLTGLQNIQTSLNQLVVPGSQELKKGITSLNDSAKTLSGYGTQLAEGLEAFSAHPELATNPDFQKLVQLSKGLSGGLSTMSLSLDEKIKPGMDNLADGIYHELDDPDNPKTLKYGIDRLVVGQSTLNTKIKDELVPGFAVLAAGTTQLDASWKEMLIKLPEMADGASLVAEGNEAVNLGWQALTTGVTDLKKGSTLISAGTSDVNTGWKTLVTKVAELKGGTSLISAGTADVNTGWKALTAGAKDLNSGSEQIAAGNQSVNTGWQTLTSGVTQLYGGTSQVAAGNAEVNSGWRQLSAGAGEINDGMQQVSDGTQTVQTGWGDLTDGATQINDGVGKIKDGSSELASGLGDGAKKTGAINATDENIEMFSSPVKTVGEKVNGYQYYRDSTAPYIISLALFVGMLIMSFFVDFKKPVEPPGSAFSWFLGKYMTLSIFAIVQALLVSIFALTFLQLEVGNAFSFILFAIFVSMTFMTIIFFLVSFAGNIGRFIALVFIVLQLSITGANLPIEMLPENLRNLSEYLPLTYTNAGFKSVISLDDAGYMLSNTGILFIYLAIFAVLALCVFLFSGRKQVDEIG